MEAVTMVLVFLLAIVVSRILARLLPVPLPILQIGIGAALSYGIDFNVRLDPGIFFLVFIPPLLFLDGWRIPSNTLFNDWRPIVTLALGLVVFTVIGVGLLIDGMIPAVPLAVAFAVAAIVSPTDPARRAASGYSRERTRHRSRHRYQQPVVAGDIRDRHHDRADGSALPVDLGITGRRLLSGFASRRVAARCVSARRCDSCSSPRLPVLKALSHSRAS